MEAYRIATGRKTSTATIPKIVRKLNDDIQTKATPPSIEMIIGILQTQIAQNPYLLRLINQTNNTHIVYVPRQRKVKNLAIQLVNACWGKVVMNHRS